MGKLCKCGCGNSVCVGNSYIHGHNRRGLASFTANGRWSMKFDCCVGCGTTSVVHQRDGYCSTCARRLLRSGKLSRKRTIISGWSRKHEKCVVCGTTDVPHKAGGFCERCYVNEYVHKNKGVKTRYKWATGFECCVGCGKTESVHEAFGLCYNCHQLGKRKEKGLFIISCPICGVSVSRIGQHLAMLSKSCSKHKTELDRREHSAIALFDSNMSSVCVSEVVGLSKAHVLRLWNRTFSRERVRIRGEAIRKGKISGQNHYLFGKNPDDVFGNRRTYEYSGHRFRSTWELHLAEYLDTIGVVWEYEKYKFLYRDIGGQFHYYWPDFYISDLDIFIEVKGYYSEDDKHKVREVSNHYNISIVVFDKDAPKELWDTL